MGSVESQVDIGFGRSGNFAKRFTIDRRDIVKIGAVDGGNPLATNVILILGFELNNGSLGAWICVDHSDLFVINVVYLDLKQYPFLVRCKNHHRLEICNGIHSGAFRSMPALVAGVAQFLYKIFLRGQRAAQN